MSSVLPDEAPPAYVEGRGGFRGQGRRFHDGFRGRPPFPPHQQRRAPADRGVRRSTECPCAVRLYHLQGRDIASRSEYCSLVLGAPSVGIRDAAVAEGVLQQDGRPTPVTAVESPAPTQKDGGAVPCAPTASAAVERPVAVQLAWADTTVWEVALTALRALRADVDAAHTAEVRRAATSGQAGNGPNDTRRRIDEVAHGKGGDGDEDGDEEAATYSTPLHRYEVELLTGSVSPQGQASIIPLCTVECRQVLPGHPALLPVRAGSSLDYYTALYELTYNLGDPVFVTCRRTV